MVGTGRWKAPDGALQRVETTFILSLANQVEYFAQLVRAKFGDERFHLVGLCGPSGWRVCSIS
jgi:hypothetical protein